MVTVLISCLFGIGLSLIVSWVIFKSNFLQNIMKSIFGVDQVDNWHTRFNHLIGEKAKKFGGKFDDSEQKIKTKISEKVERPKNWQEEIFTKIQGNDSIIKFIKDTYHGDKNNIRKIAILAKVDSRRIQTFVREILASESDFSFFNIQSITEYFALRCYLQSFRENSSNLKEENDYALMGIYLSKCGISEKQLHEYWIKNKKSIYLKFKVRPVSQCLKVEKELAYQYKKLSILEKNILSFKLKIENFKESNRNKSSNSTHKQTHKNNVIRLNPDKYQDALKIFNINEISSKSSLKKQYRKLAMEYHPDRVQSKDKDKAHKEFVQIQKAFETLSKYAA